MFRNNEIYSYSTELARQQHIRKFHEDGDGTYVMIGEANIQNNVKEDNNKNTVTLKPVGRVSTYLNDVR